MAKRPIFYLAAGLVLGILIGEKSRWYLWLAVILAVAGVAVSLGRQKKYGYLISYSMLFLGMVLFGSCLYEKNEAQYEQEEEKIADGMTILVQGTVSGRETSEDQTIYELTHCYANLETGIFSCESIEAELSEDEYLIGTTLVVKGTVKKWSRAENEGNFDAASYYKSQKKAFRLTGASVEAVYGKADLISEKLEELKQDLIKVYQSCMTEETAGVLVTMALGDKTLLNDDLKNGYQEAGISHILAISGLHVSLIGMTLYRLLRRARLSFGQAGVLAGMVLYYYGKMVGMGTSTKRAVLMFGLCVFAAWVGRTYDSMNALGLAAIFLLGNNPFLLWNAGFLFSFSAVLGVVWIVRGVEKVKAEKEKVKAEKEKRTAREKVDKPAETMDGAAEKVDKSAEAGDGVAEKDGRRRFELARRFGKKFTSTMFVSACIQFMTAPLTAYFYYEIPIYSVVLNACVLPVVGIVLGFGIVGGIVGLFCLPLAKILLLPCQFLLHYYNLICNLNSSLPGAVQITGKPSLGAMVLFYLLLVFLIFQMKRKKRYRYLLAGFFLLAALLFYPKETGFELDVLSVGQGDGIFLRSEDGVCFFIDGGSTSSSGVGTYRILPFLKSKGVREISYWFITHTDEDHISGLLEVLESGYPIENLVFSERIGRDETFQKIAALAEAQGTTLLFLSEGDCLHTKSAHLTCLFPDASYATEDKNALSLVLLYEEEEFRAIFTGDISSEEERYLLEQKDVKGVDFYKAAHHGSKYSNCSEWLETLSPSVSAISCGKNNRYGHPGAEAVEHMEASGSTVYDTRMSGQIKVRKRDGELVVEEYLE